MKTILCLLSFTLLSLSCKRPTVKEYTLDGLVFFNQTGYLPNYPIKLIGQNEVSSAWLVTENSDTIALEVKAPRYWKFAHRDYVQIESRSPIPQGKYDVWINNIKYGAITSDSNAFSPLAKAALKAFYLTRASMNIDEEFAGKWSRTAGHPDTLVYVHASAADTDRPEGSIISSPGGWYDAGDYNKYIVSSAISVYTLLSFYELFPAYSEEILQVNIPKKYKNLPCILDEAWYNIEWMLTMQAPDGGVYHKLTCRKFEDFVPANKAKGKRYVVQKSTPATLDFAAVMSKAARIYQPFDSTKYHKLYRAAQKAMQWADKNPAVYYHQPPDIETGAYPDTTLTDEWLWAQTEYALLTKNPSLISIDTIMRLPYTTPSWDVVTTLAGLTILQHAGFFPTEIEALSNQQFETLLNQLCEKYNESAMLTSLDYFKWGSNSDVLNQAMLAIYGYRFFHNPNYYQLALENANYILGRNGTGYCFITGFGIRSPKHIHHRLSGSDTVDAPMPGLIAGGPNLIVPDDMGEQRSEYPALAYIDHIDSYSTNEIAINWNAPAVFVFGAIDAIK